MTERDEHGLSAAPPARPKPAQLGGKPGSRPTALPSPKGSTGRPCVQEAALRPRRRGQRSRKATFPPPGLSDGPQATRPHTSSGSGPWASSATAHLLTGTSITGHSGLKQGWGTTAFKQIKTPFKIAPSRRCGQRLSHTNSHGPQPRQPPTKWQLSATARLSAGAGGEEPRGACRERHGRGEQARRAEVRHTERKCVTRSGSVLGRRGDGCGP